MGHKLGSLSLATTISREDVQDVSSTCWLHLPVDTKRDKCFAYVGLAIVVDPLLLLQVVCVTVQI